ncbi:MAG: hypothetical protein IKU29_07375, partial [Parabacteroides sp.]|nr:hypothetical protein [Parabacteroides sp.]
VFFHRLAKQALTSGPILAMNIKPFGNDESVSYAALDAVDLTESGIPVENINKYLVRNLYNTNRFWSLNDEDLPSPTNKYINIFATDVKENSCTFFIRPHRPNNYNITIREWFTNLGEEIPQYLENLTDSKVKEFFAEVYVFRGEFTEHLQNGILSNYFENGALKTSYTNVYGEEGDVLDALANDPNSNFIGRYQGVTIPFFKDMNGEYISLDTVFNSDYNAHKCLMHLDSDLLDELAVMSVDVTLEMNGEIAETTTALAEGSNALPRMLWSIDDKYYVFNNGSTPNLALKPIYLQGYVYTSIDRSVAGIELQKRVFNFLSQEKGLREALTNRVDVEYHYIVDTFQSYINAPQYKSILASIAKAKDNAFAILNFPPMQSFVNDSDFMEVVGDTKRFSISKIAEKYSLPSEVNGASYCGFFTQLVISDGTIKSVIPSAALVSNNFMNKWSSRQPYYIVAGPTHGRITETGLIGPDYNFDRTDLNVLEPMGVNAIIYVPRKGTYINSNQTAKQNPVSALSKIHVRELVIFLQNEIQAMLENYHWELNTQTLRDTVKAKADAILETVQNNGGVYDFLNVCDESNNSDEIIDNEMIILDTHIEPARGAGKMVHRLTLYKTGGLKTSIM